MSTSPSDRSGRRRLDLEGYVALCCYVGRFDSIEIDQLETSHPMCIGWRCCGRRPRSPTTVAEICDSLGGGTSAVCHRPMFASPCHLNASSGGHPPREWSCSKLFLIGAVGAHDDRPLVFRQPALVVCRRWPQNRTATGISQSAQPDPGIAPPRATMSITDHVALAKGPARRSLRPSRSVAGATRWVCILTPAANWQAAAALDLLIVKVSDGRVVEDDARPVGASASTPSGERLQSASLPEPRSQIRHASRRQMSFAHAYGVIRRVAAAGSVSCACKLRNVLHRVTFHKNGSTVNARPPGISASPAMTAMCGRSHCRRAAEGCAAILAVGGASTRHHGQSRDSELSRSYRNPTAHRCAAGPIAASPSQSVSSRTWG